MACASANVDDRAADSDYPSNPGQSFHKSVWTGGTFHYVNAAATLYPCLKD
jgi:hypothetical protein